MHELGFEVVTIKKGTFVDDHEHEDVEYRKKSLIRMMSLGFHNPDEDDAALPIDVTSLSSDIIDKTVFLFQDKTKFSSKRSSIHCVDTNRNESNVAKVKRKWDYDIVLQMKSMNQPNRVTPQSRSIPGGG